jgi:phosphoribosyl-dephospho-CoA transferase
VIESLQRHALLRVTTLGWQRALARSPALASRPYVPEWAGRGWPVIVRRYLPEDAAGLIPVAIPLPPQAGKPGATLQLQPEEIHAPLPPVALSACLDAAPVAWRETLHSLLASSERCGCAPAVFGSLLWQMLTGLTYLHERSDLDLLWRVTRHEQAEELVRSIARCARKCPMRIDGELVLPDGAGVHWREWDGAAEVLVRTLHRVERRRTDQLFQESWRAGQAV